MLKNAENALNSEELNFSRELESYKNALTLYAFEKKLISQQLDTNVSDKQIEAYYENNQDHFELRSNIVKVTFVKLMLNSTMKSKAKNLLTQSKSRNLKAAEKFFKENAVNYFLDEDTWLLFDDILKEIPIATYNREEYLKTHPVIETQDSLFDYIVVIKDFKSKEGTSPLSFEKENIHQIILTKRKADLLNRYKKQMMQQAAASNSIEIY